MLELWQQEKDLFLEFGNFTNIASWLVGACVVCVASSWKPAFTYSRRKIYSPFGENIEQAKPELSNLSAMAGRIGFILGVAGQ